MVKSCSMLPEMSLSFLAVQSSRKLGEGAKPEIYELYSRDSVQINGLKEKHDNLKGMAKYLSLNY